MNCSVPHLLQLRLYIVSQAVSVCYYPFHLPCLSVHSSLLRKITVTKFTAFCYCIKKGVPESAHLSFTFLLYPFSFSLHIIFYAVLLLIAVTRAIAPNIISKIIPAKEVVSPVAGVAARAGFISASLNTIT